MMNEKIVTVDLLVFTFENHGEKYTIPGIWRGISWAKNTLWKIATQTVVIFKF